MINNQFYKQLIICESGIAEIYNSLSVKVWIKYHNEIVELYNSVKVEDDFEGKNTIVKRLFDLLQTIKNKIKILKSQHNPDEEIKEKPKVSKQQDIRKWVISAK